MGTVVAGARPFDAKKDHRMTPLFYHTSTKKAAVIPRVTAFPDHYEPVASTLEWKTAPLVKDLGHARIRQIEKLGLCGVSGHSSTSYIVEVKGPKGRYWTDFAWSSNPGQLYGDVLIQLCNARRREGAVIASAVVAFNGASGEWESFEQRAAI